jgi:hypothetical protein
MILLPNDVREWLTIVFRGCSERTSAKLSRLGNTSEMHSPKPDSASTA